MILPKLPGHLQIRWDRNVLRIMRSKMKKNRLLLNLTKLIEDEIILFKRHIVLQRSCPVR